MKSKLLINSEIAKSMEILGLKLLLSQSFILLINVEILTFNFYEQDKFHVL